MISTHVWVITGCLLLALFSFDLIHAARKPRAVKTLEASLWTIFYIVLALGFALYLSQDVGAEASNEFIAGWLTEYSLSVDNLFVFIIIFRTLNVPAERIQSVLMAGIALALLFRGIFIAIGAVIIHQFVGIFYLFGIFLLYTGWHVGRGGGGDDDWKEPRLIQSLRRKGMSTISLAVIALGITDVLFAVDSIPAIFGLTNEPFIVFTANAFALLGLRQLYFLLGNMAEKLVFLSHGLGLILAFIGFKLIFEAMDGTGVKEILGLKVPHISTNFSLLTIVSILAITIFASVIRAGRTRE